MLLMECRGALPLPPSASLSRPSSAAPLTCPRAQRYMMVRCAQHASSRRRRRCHGRRKAVAPASSPCTLHAAGVDELFSLRGHRSFFNTHSYEEWRLVRQGSLAGGWRRALAAGPHGHPGCSLRRSARSNVCCRLPPAAGPQGHCPGLLAGEHSQGVPPAPQRERRPRGQAALACAPCGAACSSNGAVRLRTASLLLQNASAPAVLPSSRWRCR